MNVSQEISCLRERNLISYMVLWESSFSIFKLYSNSNVLHDRLPKKTTMGAISLETERRRANFAGTSRSYYSEKSSKKLECGIIQILKFAAKTLYVSYQQIRSIEKSTECSISKYEDDNHKKNLHSGDMILLVELRFWGLSLERDLFWITRVSDRTAPCEPSLNELDLTKRESRINVEDVGLQR